MDVDNPCATDYYDNEIAARNQNFKKILFDGTEIFQNSLREMNIRCAVF